MKKILAAFCVCIVLSTCCLSAFALTDAEASVDEAIDKSQPAYIQMMHAATMLQYISDDASYPLQTRIYQENGLYYVDATYTPSYYLDYFLNNSYYKINPKTDYLKLFVDIRIDGGKWVSETGVWGMFEQVFNLSHQLPLANTEPYTFTLFKPVPINEDLPLGPFEEAFEIKDGYYSLDLSKHTVEATVTIQLVFEAEYDTFYLPTTPTSYIRAITQSNLPQQLPEPNIQRVIASTQNNTLSLQITPHSVIDGLQALSHDMYVKVKYKLHNQTTTREIPYTQQTFIEIDLGDVEWVPAESITADKNNDLIVECTFYDKTTNQISPGCISFATIQTAPDNALVEDWLTNGTDSATATETESAKNNPDEDSTPVTNTITPPDTHKGEKVCGVCGVCPVQPFTMCLWLFIGAVVFLIAAGIIGIFIYKEYKQSKS